MQYSHIQARAFNEPLMLDPDYARFAFAFLASRMRFAEMVDAEGARHAGHDLPALAESFRTRSRRVNRDSGQWEKFALVGPDQNIAVIPVDGTLVHKAGYLDPYSGMQGYDGLRGKMEAAAADGRVAGVLLDFNTPGGEVSGGFDMADYIEQFSATGKPVWALADDLMASAGYLLGSQAERIFATQTARVGSIGVILAHTDRSKQLAAEGVQVTLITSGAHKADGHPFGELPADVREQIQADLDAVRVSFADRVGRKRAIGAKGALETEARVYRGSAAVDAGLVDGVASFDAVVSEFSRRLSSAGLSITLGGVGMEKKDPTADMQAAISEALGKQATEHAKAIESAKADARKGERERVAAILASDEAKGRESMAHKLAFERDQSAAEAIELLAMAPKADAKPVAAGLPKMADVVSAAGVPVDRSVQGESAATGATADANEARPEVMNVIRGVFGIKAK